MRSRWRPIRSWSINIEVSKMTKLLTRAFETKFAGVFRHQLFETLQGDNLPQGDVNCLGARFYPEDFHSLIGQVCIQANRRQRECHIYIISSLYIRLEGRCKIEVAWLPCWRMAFLRVP